MHLKFMVSSFSCCSASAKKACIVLVEVRVLKPSEHLLRMLQRRLLAAEHGTNPPEALLFDSVSFNDKSSCVVCCRLWCPS